MKQDDNWCEYGLHNNCKHIKDFKSHSQDHQQGIKSLEPSIVRVSEEEKKGDCYHPNLPSSDSLYLSLTKKNVHENTEYGDIIVKWRVLSALNGYKKEMRKYIMPEYLNHFNEVLEKWFEVLREQKIKGEEE